MTRQVCLTMDLDWTSEVVLRDTLELLDSFGVRATLFAVGSLQALDAAREQEHEIAVHPVVDVGDLNSMNERIVDMKQMFPEAIGIRAHALFSSTFFLRKYLEVGFKYTCDHYVPGQPRLFPFMRLKKLVCLPYCWEDDSYIGEEVTLADLNLYRDGLMIYNFHPVHVYLNTRSMDRYQQARPHYLTDKKFRTFRQAGYGTRTLFLEFLGWMRDRKKLCLQTCGEVAEAFDDRR